jgi:hypothetical protein
MYCPSLKRMHVTCTACVQSLKIRDGGRGKHINLVKNMSVLSLHDVLPTGRHMLKVSFIISLKPNSCTAVTTQNTIENKHVILHALNTVALQARLFLTGYCPRTKDSRIFPAPINAKVNFKLCIPYR